MSAPAGIARPLRALLVIVAAACADGLPEAPSRTPPDDGAVLRLDQHRLTLGFRRSTTLVASRTDSAGNPMPAPIEWISRNPLVAVVDDGGTLLGTGVGVTWIVASDLVHTDSAHVTAVASYRTIHAGTDVTCGLTTVGVPLCWGWNGFGSLGNGGGYDSPTPVPVRGLPRYDELTMGAGTVCGLADGATQCWGYNGVGQVGDGTTLSRAAPVDVVDDVPYRSVTLGSGATACAFSAAGGLRCWGWNSFGQLLNGSSLNSHQPIQVNPGFAVTSIASGGGQVCALDDAGRAWCWGRNDRGQVGDGATDSVIVPRAVLGAPAFIQIAAGMEHSCGRTAAGQLWCWGDNRRGQLAGTTGPGDDTDLPQLAAGGMPFDTVATSAYHVCALAAGIAWCWGDNAFGQLGTGTAGGTDSRPERVAGDLRFRSISAGVHHTCGISTDGVAWCWGGNRHGSLGDGTNQDQAVPTRVAFQP